MKTLIRISQILAVPTFFASMFYVLTGFDHFMGDGAISRAALSWTHIPSVIMALSTLSFLGMTSMLATLLLIFPLAGKMVAYEDEVAKLHEEKKQWSDARKRLISAAMKLENLEK